MKIGFSKLNLEAALFPKQEIREPIEAVATYFEEGQSKALWITLDFMDFNRKYTDTVRAAIAVGCCLECECVHLFTTHNHGGGNPDLDILASLCVTAAKTAIATARRVKARFAFTESDQQLNIKRRLYFPEFNATSTLFFGACRENNFNAALFRERVIKNFEEKGVISNSIAPSTDLPYERFAEGDREIFIMQFTDEEGVTVGSFVRFAAHAVTANRQGSYSSDYPFYVRKTVEEALGGICMFLNGPCGEIAPGMLDKQQGMERVLGEHIASLALSAIKDKTFLESRGFYDRRIEIKLPVRDEVVQNCVTVDDTPPSSPPEKWRYLERLTFKRTLPFLYEKYSEGETQLTDKVSVFVCLTELFGVTFLGFPGETFNATAKAVKESFAHKNIVTATEHDRTVMYLPPEAEFALGGYESTCKLTAGSAEGVLRTEVTDALLDYFKENKDEV